MRRFIFAVLFLGSCFGASLASATVIVKSLEPTSSCTQKFVPAPFGGEGISYTCPMTSVYSTDETDSKLAALNLDFTTQLNQRIDSLAQQISAVQNQQNAENLRAMIRQIVDEELNKQRQ